MTCDVRSCKMNETDISYFKEELKMTKTELKQYLIETYHVDSEELKDCSKEELLDMLHEFEDHSDLFPNDDEYDGSHDWD